MLVTSQGSKLWRFDYTFKGKRKTLALGSYPEISKLDVLIREGKIGTAKKIRILIGQILRYALAKGLIQYDPTSALRGIIPQVKEKHMPAVTDEKKFAEILKAFWDYPHSLIVKYALRVLVYTFQRPGEVVSMKWEDIDFEKKEWRFVLSKVDREHIVPLARQVVRILEELRQFTGHTPFVFASLVSPQTRHITVETLNAALRRMGINTKEEQTAHGFRATARTLLHEVLGYQPDIIEHQLGHRVPDRLGEAYNRTKFLEERKKMMQEWADFIDKLIKD